MSEAALWDTIREGMTARWHAQRHEDKLSKGIPDVSFGIQRLADGWIELKFLDGLPKHTGRKWDFAWDHFTSDQRNWLHSRLRHGTGRVFVVCQFGIGGPVVIWNWARLEPVLGCQSFAEILLAANAQWWRGVDFGEFEKVLAGNRIIQPRFAV